MLATLRKLREKNLHIWLGGWTRQVVAGRGRAEPVTGPRHLLFAFCDHYEPLWGGAKLDVGRARVKAWTDGYPRLARSFVDADGHHPRHSFFFPGEQYAPDFLAPLADLARAGFGEVELHLHHDGDTPATLRRDLDAYLHAFARHGHLARDRAGRRRYAFIHGNWCLANSRKDGRKCGVDAEIPLLWDTGCYADYTFPSAPDESQPHIVNRIYWPEGDLAARRAYERGTPARVGERRDDRILIIQGPLALARRAGRVMVRVESSGVTAADPPSPDRIRTWAAQNIHVAGRPEWVFVKVYTHGAPEKQAGALLGDGGLALHRELVERYNDGARWRLHYVTAREMYNIALAAMDGQLGDPGQYRDYALPPPPAAKG